MKAKIALLFATLGALLYAPGTIALYLYMLHYMVEVLLQGLQGALNLEEFMILL